MALELEPDNIKGLLKRVRIAITVGNLDLAESDWKRINSDYSNDVDVQNNLKKLLPYLERLRKKQSKVLQESFGGLFDAPARKC